MSDVTISRGLFDKMTEMMHVQMPQLVINSHEDLPNRRPLTASEFDELRKLGVVT